MSLCQEIQNAGIQPFYFGFKDTWTCLAPWNAVAVDLAPADVCAQVNRGKTTFSKEYKEVAERMLELLPYGPDDPFAYDYNGACTAFAKGESAMYTIGSYAIPQIQTVNPDMEIDSFVMPASNNKEENTLNSGIDLQFCVMQDCKNKEAAYEVLDFLLNDENVQAYLDDQKAVPCKEGDFELASTLDGMKKYIKEGKTGTVEPVYLYEGKSRDTNDIGGTYVEISIQDQEMWCYKDGVVVVDTPVVTGNVSKGYDTPAGSVWAIDAKKHDAVLKGEGYTQPVTYWMPFNGNVGIHDADTWRSQYGGEIYKTSGSHGCVNTPTANAEKIFNTVEIGTPVIVY